MEGVVEPLRHLKPLGHMELLVVVGYIGTHVPAQWLIGAHPTSARCACHCRPLKGCGSEALQRGIHMVDA
jgi:hypothetical protein